MSPIQTLTDLVQTQSSQASLNGSAHSVPTTVTVTLRGPDMNEILRDHAESRLAPGNLRLPFRIQLNGRTIEDSSEIERLNEVLNEEQIRAILTNVSNSTSDSEILSTILNNLSESTVNGLQAVLNQPVITIDSVAPFLNVFLYANVGIGDLNLTTTYLANIISEMNANIIVPNFEEIQNSAHQRLEENETTVNREIERNAQGHNINRRWIFSRNVWTLLGSAGSVLAFGTAIYMGSPYLNPLITNIGMSMFERNNGSRPGLTPVTRVPGDSVEWSHISQAFWLAWDRLLLIWVEEIKA